MIGRLAPPAAVVPNALSAANSSGTAVSNPTRTRQLVETLLRLQGALGITRVGTITRLDRIGLPVVQVVRPLALSNAVTQGKGATPEAAAASALMEALETWAAERIPRDRVRVARAQSLEPEMYQPFSGVVPEAAHSDWDLQDIAWIDGWDLVAHRVCRVPLALVDTCYTLPSPHPHIFSRNTTGLGAGSTLAQAVIHAGLECLERDARARAHRTPHFFDLHRIDLATHPGPETRRVLALLERAGIVAAAWQAPARHGLPVYTCQVMEADERSELVPLPAEGAACDTCDDHALARALMEACQARLAAISGAREDITRAAYPAAYDREELAAWRAFLMEQPALPATAMHADQAVGRAADRLAAVIAALRTAGAHMIAVVPLLVDDTAGLHVVRLVAPPLATDPGHAP